MARSSLIALALIAGCGSQATVIDVRVRFDDTAHHPTALDVTLSVGPQTLLSHVAIPAPRGRSIRSGDDVTIEVPDSAANKPCQATLYAVEPNQPTLSGDGAGLVAGRSTVVVEVPLGDGLPDGGVGDGGASEDGAMQVDLGCGGGCLVNGACVAVGGACGQAAVCVPPGTCVNCGRNQQACCAGNIPCPNSDGNRCKLGVCQ